MVPRNLFRHRLTVAALAAIELAIVAAVAHADGTDGTLSTVAALALAPIAVVATATLGRRLDGDRFAVGAAAVYVVLPLLANRFMLGTYRSTFDHRVLPDLLGLRATPWFALGVLVAVVLAVAPLRVGAVAGIVVTAIALVVWGTSDLAAVHAGLHETAWSITLLEWLFVAGVIGVARRSVWLALGCAGWIAALGLHAAHVGYGDGAFWQSLAAGAPVTALLVSSLALLVPPLRGRTTPAAERSG